MHGKDLLSHFLHAILFFCKHDLFLQLKISKQSQFLSLLSQTTPWLLTAHESVVPGLAVHPRAPSYREQPTGLPEAFDFLGSSTDGSVRRSEPSSLHPQDLALGLAHGLNTPITVLRHQAPAPHWSHFYKAPALCMMLTQVRSRKRAWDPKMKDTEPCPYSSERSTS
jgi:hypothetical protein